MSQHAEFTCLTSGRSIFDPSPAIGFIANSPAQVRCQVHSLTQPAGTHAPGYRICLTADDFLPAATGVGVHLKLVAPELVRRGHRVSIITTRRSGEPELEEWQGVRVHRVPTLPIYGFYQALPSDARIRRILAEEQPHVVHHHYMGYLMWRSISVATACKIPQISTWHFGPEVLTHPLPLRPFRGLVRGQMMRLNNLCDMVISPSANLAQQLKNGGLRTPVRCISNPMPFGNTADVTLAERPAPFVVLFAGRLGPEKNLPYLLRAFAQLRRTRPESALWIAGRGPEEGKLRTLVAELGLEQQVHFLGFVDHEKLAGYYAACDVFVLPSLQEVQPMVAIEAMWFARPVILTSALAVADELITQGENGHIVDPTNVADLAKRLDELAASPTLRKTMGLAGQQRAQAYRLDTMVDTLEMAYRDVCAH